MSTLVECVMLVGIALAAGTLALVIIGLAAFVYVEIRAWRLR